MFAALGRIIHLAMAHSPLLKRLLDHPPDREAISHPGMSGVTYGDLGSGSARTARSLLGDRVDGRDHLQGDAVAILLPPGDEFVMSLLGVWQAGGVAVPLSPAHTPPELAHILRTSAPVATIMDATAEGPAAVACRGMMGRRIDVNSIDGSSEAGSPAVLPSVLPSVVPSDDAALMLFTSGTTGKPKGVRLSHAGVAATLDSLADAWRWRADDRLLHVLPLYHTHGLIVALLGTLWAGATVRFLPFDAGAVWDGLAGASVFMAVPTIYVRLLEAFAAATVELRARWMTNARGLRLFTSGSAALPGSVLAAFAQATGQTILERYGMTEIGMALSNPYDGPRIAGSVGAPLPAVHVDIVDESGRATADGQPGELRVQSPQLFLGYHGDPEATAASYDSSGRFRTGDTGVRGPDGFVRLLGRTSVDILKSGGYKLSALEIEDALREHPAVAEVAVIGVPDSVWGDCVTACVVPRPGHALALDDLRDFARDTLAPYKLPRALRLLPALPRNGMGKVQKSLLK